MITKHMQYVCPDAGHRKPDNKNEPTECGHIHWEADISCRYVATQHIKPDRICKMT